MGSEQNRKEILVYTYSFDLSKPLLMGVLSATIVRGKEVFSFEYASSFLESDVTFEIDPHLKLYSGIQYLRNDEQNFGIFLDSSPDRWGQLLMDRREAIRSRLEQRTPRRLMESDYLPGVFDEFRMGALRFKTDHRGPFLNDDPNYSTPPMTLLRDLEFAATEFESESSMEDDESLRRLSLLFAPGSSLGGARPKASVMDENGELWIAKFPSKNDQVDVGVREYLVYELAILGYQDGADAQSGLRYQSKPKRIWFEFEY